MHKLHLFVMALCISLLFSSGIVFSQKNELRFELSKSTYRTGDTIVISGTVEPLRDIILIQIFYGKQRIHVAQVDVSPNGKFSYTLIADGSHWKNSGKHTVQISQGPTNNIVKTTFDFIAKENQKFSNEISFSGNIGLLLNCKIFSYEVPIYIASEANVPVTIEIIDPQGKIAGQDKFESRIFDSPRIIKMNWGNDGIYLIQVHYKGETYTEDFVYNNLTQKTFQGYRMECLKDKYIESFKEKTYSLFNTSDNPQDRSFWNNVKTTEILLRQYEPQQYAENYRNIVSEKMLNYTWTQQKTSKDPAKILPLIKKLGEILPELIENKAIELSLEWEENIQNDDSLTIDEQTDLIFQLKKERDSKIIPSQKQFSKKYVNTLYSFYNHIKQNHENIEKLEKMAQNSAKKKIEQKLKDENVKNSIKQKFLSKNKSNSYDKIIFN